MNGREDQIRAFLAAGGFGSARREPLAGDASARRYERLRDGPSPAVLMDAPPGQNDVRPFLGIAARLADRGFSPPLVLAADPDAGLVLLEDLGDRSFNRLLDEGADAHLLYGAAVDLLVDLQREDPGALPPYDDDRLLAEASLLPEWYAPGLTPAARDAYLRTFAELLPLARAGPDTFVYVDYHADNLLWLPAREGRMRIGLLDFQDARLGPPAYDLVSLLEDARRDVDPALAEAMLARYLTRRPELNAGAFRAAYALLGAQRNAKILGLFARLALRDHKPRYLAFLPRVRAHLRRDLAHPALRPLAAWFARHLRLSVAS